MALIEIEFPSRNGRDTIHGWVYEPTVPARAVVQIVHGLGGHSRRYLRLITRLLDAGFVVAADDHAGHGKTATESGVWADAGADADQVVVADELGRLGEAEQDVGVVGEEGPAIGLARVHVTTRCMWQIYETNFRH